MHLKTESKDSIQKGMEILESKLKETRTNTKYRSTEKTYASIMMF